MRILHIIPNLQKGGAERLCLDICSGLGSRPGVDVQLVYLNNSVKYDTREVTCALHFIPASVRLSLTKPTQYNTTGLEKFIKEFQPDIIHSHLFEAEIVSRSIDFPKAKWFSHGHDNMHQLQTFSLGSLFNKKKLTEFYERTYLLRHYRANGGNRFIAISKDVQHYFDKVLPADLRNVILLPNAINRSRFTHPADYKAPAGTTIKLVTAGSLVDKKNQTFLIDVVQQIVKQNTSVHLHVLGDGPNRKMLEDKTVLLGLSNNITFHGNVAQVQQYLWNADIYVHGAYYEPFGLVLVEAMAAGLPVVSLDGRGNRDIIINGKNGYILPEQNAAVFAGKILELTTNKQLYNDIKAAGLLTAARFDIANYVDKLLEHYKQSLLQ